MGNQNSGRKAEPYGTCPKTGQPCQCQYDCALPDWDVVLHTGGRAVGLRLEDGTVFTQKGPVSRSQASAYLRVEEHEVPQALRLHLLLAKLRLLREAA